MNIKDLIIDFKANKKGIYSVCSSDEQVITAAIRQGKIDNSPVLIEATCNQVNQFGGYTNMKPEDYRDFVFSIAKKLSFDTNMIILGGDHLGTQPFKSMNSDEAMKCAKDMVELYAKAGFTKIHLDASVRCLDDHDLSVDEFEFQACERAAEMAMVIEHSCNPENISYIVGTEVPTPGGSTENDEIIKPTSASEAEKTLNLSKEAFYKRGLQDAWKRVCGLVVQPGVEFSDANVYLYDREAASNLSAFLADDPKMVYEAHSTDYQTDSKLKALVDDGYSILKVGPALTYAKSQAVFALGRIEKELFQESECSWIEQVVENVMLEKPSNWESHYHGSFKDLKLSRRYSYSDRLRYYWPDEKIVKAMEKLKNNLAKIDIPNTLIYEYMPLQYNAVREGQLKPEPAELINHHIQLELKRYSVACKLTNR